MNSSTSYADSAAEFEESTRTDGSTSLWTTAGTAPTFVWTLTPGFDIVASLPWYLLTFATIAANGTALTVFARERKLRSHVNYYVINLALADLSVGAIVLPAYSVVVTLEWYWPFFGFYGCKIFQGISYSLLTVSILTVIVISGDRFYAAVAPFSYFRNRSKKTAVGVNGLCWFLAFGIWIPFNTIWPIWRSKPPLLHSICYPEYSQTFLATIVATCILLWFPVLLLIVLNSTLYAKISNSGATSVAKSFQDKRSSWKKDGNNSTTFASTISSSTDGLNHHSNPTFIDDVQDDWNPAESDSGVDNGGIWLGSGDVDVDKENYQLNDLQAGLSVVERMNNENIMKSGWKTSEFVDGVHRLPGHDQSRRESLAKNTTVNQPADSTKVDETIRTRKDEKSSSAGPRRESSKESHRAFRILSVIVLSYILSWTMLCVVVVLISVCLKIHHYKCTTSTVDLIAMYLSLCNSLINPVCYVIVQPVFRSSIAKLFCK